MYNSLIRDEDDFVKIYSDRLKDFKFQLFGRSHYGYENTNYSLEDMNQVQILAKKIYSNFKARTKNRSRLFVVYYKCRLFDKAYVHKTFAELRTDGSWRVLEGDLYIGYSVSLDPSGTKLRKAPSYLYFNKDDCII